MESELRAYRADPTDVTFGRLYSAAYPWLKSSGISTVRRYTTLSLTGSLDDVVNEGAFALGTSARRFTYFCPNCDRVFVEDGDLARHVRSEHRRRGALARVSLGQFARTSARLAMKRTVRRIYRPEVPTEDVDRDLASGEDVEERIVLEIMIARFRERLSARARADLEALFLEVEEVERLIGVKRRTRKERRMTKPPDVPDPKWTELNIRTLRESAREVLGLASEKRTMKAAYADLYAQLRASDRDLAYACQNCDSLIDGEMKRCWACGLIFRDDADPEVVEAELLERARKLGVSVVEGADRSEVVSAIEDAETKGREARRNADLLRLESARLNEQLTEAMPDGWSKKVSRQYTAYFDGDRVRRIAVFHRGLKVHFSIEDGFLDGFADLTFFDETARKAKHFGRTNYEYSGDTSQVVFEICRRVFGEYAGGKKS